MALGRYLTLHIDPRYCKSPTLIPVLCGHDQPVFDAATVRVDATPFL